MIAAICQNLARSCFYNSISHPKSGMGFRFSITLLHFSTSGEGQSAFHRALYELLVHKHNFSLKSAAQIASVVTPVRKPEKPDAVLAFLRESGFSSFQLENVVTSYPRLLSGNLEKCIKPKIRIFQEFGISPSDAAEIITNHPELLKFGVNTLRPSFSVLKNLFESDKSVELTKFLKVHGWFLKLNLRSSLVPNVELLKNYVASVDQIRRLMHRYPRHLLRKQEEMKYFVDRIVELGLHRKSKMFIYALKVFCSSSEETLQLKMRTFREMGFSDDDIVTTFRSVPMVFGYSEAKLKGMKEFLLASGKYNPSCIVRYPSSLTRSIEKTYKPRLQLLELLEEKNLIKSWPAFSTFCSMTNKVFYEKYVTPFRDEIGDAYMVKSVTRG